ncbi:hypothetical protein FH608_035260 [Nonomuraea phyllanthi]|uniref:Uncharacterized protein n=1 Tax=Nonomuraea phyllanthi TaxID=2219224 RepID=A0A5C4VVR8_9ACTN|nr:hypothetical protein [Nonomuraea phyllanthi]KAB8190239.1 hypothetical protein FH608_035260 [Nonomuraea phyllanthi]
MDSDDAFISSSSSDEALFLATCVMVLLILLPTLIWLAVTLLRGREQSSGEDLRIRDERTSRFGR